MEGINLPNKVVESEQLRDTAMGEGSTSSSSQTMGMKLPGEVGGSMESIPLRDTAAGECSKNGSSQMLEVVSQMLEEELRQVNLLLASRHKSLLLKLSQRFGNSTENSTVVVKDALKGPEPDGGLSSVGTTLQIPDNCMTPKWSQRPSSPKPVLGKCPTLLEDAASDILKLKGDTARKVNAKGSSIPFMVQVAHIVQSRKFEAFFAVLICMNSCIMALELQYQGINYGNTYFGKTGYWEMRWAKGFFLFCDWFFGIIFTGELIANISVKHVEFFFRPMEEDEAEVRLGRRRREIRLSIRKRCFDLAVRTDCWGFLDVAIVVVWILDTFLAAFFAFDPMILKLIRLAKLLRMLRLVRTIKQFDSLYLLTTTIRASVSALFWSCVLLFVIQALIAYVLCERLQEFYETESHSLEDREEVWRHFGTYTRAVFTMFEVTLGNWPPVGRLLMEKISEWFILFSLAHKLTVGFAVVNVINAVFMQMTFNIAANDDHIMLTQRERGARIHKSKMSKLFSRGDIEGDGLLSREEFSHLMADPVLRKWMASMQISIHNEEDIDEVFSLIAGDDNQVSLDELVKETSRLKGAARTIDVDLRFQEIKSILKELIPTSPQHQTTPQNGSWLE